MEDSEWSHLPDGHPFLELIPLFPAQADGLVKPPTLLFLEKLDDGIDQFAITAACAVA